MVPGHAIAITLVFAFVVWLSSVWVRSIWSHRLPRGREQYMYRVVATIGVAIGIFIMAIVSIYILLYLDDSATTTVAVILALSMHSCMFLLCMSSPCPDDWRRGVKDSQLYQFVLIMFIPFAWPLTAECIIPKWAIFDLQGFLVCIECFIGTGLVTRVLMRYDTKYMLSKVGAMISVVLMAAISTYSVTSLDYQSSMVTSVYVLGTMIMASLIENYGEEEIDNPDAMLFGAMAFPLVWAIGALCGSTGFDITGLAMVLMSAVVFTIAFFYAGTHERYAWHHQVMMAFMQQAPTVVMSLWTLTTFVFLLVGKPSCGSGVLWTVSSNVDEVNDRIRQILKLNQKMPLWMNFMVAGVKPIILAKVFGLPKVNDTTAKASTAKLYLIGPCFNTLALVAVLSDMSHLFQLANCSEVVGWSSLHAAMMMGAVSSNMQTSIGFCTIAFNYYMGAGQDWFVAFKNVVRLQGRMWVIVMGAITAVYLPWLLLTIAYIFPGVLFYAWWSIPIGLGFLLYYSLIRGAAHGGLVARLLLGDGESDTEDDEAEWEKLDIEERRRLARAQQDHDALKAQQERVKSARALTPVAPIIGAFVPIIVPIVARFYMGEGYLSAMTTTWEDRHVPDFVQSLTTTATHSFQTAEQATHQMGTADFDGLFGLAIQWVQTLNYIF